jgi:hypothetical protein
VPAPGEAEPVSIQPSSHADSLRASTARAHARRSHSSQDLALALERLTSEVALLRGQLDIHVEQTATKLEPLLAYFEERPPFHHDPCASRSTSGAFSRVTSRASSRATSTTHRLAPKLMRGWRRRRTVEPPATLVSVTPDDSYAHTRWSMADIARDRARSGELERAVSEGAAAAVTRRNRGAVTFSRSATEAISPAEAPAEDPPPRKACRVCRPCASCVARARHCGLVPQGDETGWRPVHSPGQ